MCEPQHNILQKTEAKQHQFWVLPIGGEMINTTTQCNRGIISLRTPVLGFSFAYRVGDGCDCSRYDTLLHEEQRRQTVRDEVRWLMSQHDILILHSTYAKQLRM